MNTYLVEPLGNLQDQATEQALLVNASTEADLVAALAGTVARYRLNTTTDFATKPLDVSADLIQLREILINHQIVNAETNPCVARALEIVREQLPSITTVFYDEDLRWQFTDDEGDSPKWPASIDQSVLEAAADELTIYPAVFRLDPPDNVMEVRAPTISRQRSIRFVAVIEGEVFTSDEGGGPEMTSEQLRANLDFALTKISADGGITQDTPGVVDFQDVSVRVTDQVDHSSFEPVLESLDRTTKAEQMLNALYACWTAGKSTDDLFKQWAESQRPLKQQ